MKLFIFLCAFVMASSVFASDGSKAKQADEPRPLTSTSTFPNIQVAADPTLVLLHVADVKLGQVGAQPTNGVNVQRPAGVGAGAGILGSLIGMMIVKGINDSRERGAQAYAERFGHAQARIDMKKELAEQVRTAFMGNRHIQDVRLEYPEYASDLEQPGLLTRIQEKNILTLNLDYGLGRDQKKLKVILTAKLWHKDEITPVFTSSIEDISEEVQGKDVSELNEQWLANDGELLIGQLRSGIAKASRSLANDIEQRMNVVPQPEVEKQALK